MSFHVTSFYYFSATPWPSETISDVRQKLIRLGQNLKLRGLILVGSEGINATISGPQQDIQHAKIFIGSELGLKDLLFKDSLSSENPFVRYKVQLRDEIVTMGSPGLAPKARVNRHVTPQEFHELMLDRDTITLDTRNAFEIEVGKFKGALDFSMTEFNQFPERLKKSGLPKNKKILIYCTGGIRCEKAILEMESQGYESVYQLEGGILKYLEDVKEDSHWEGDCFVFDRRVALDANLEPSRRWELCPHCGTPADISKVCLRCDSDFKLCAKCAEAPERQTCSKHCHYNYKVRPGIKGPQQRKPLL